MIRGVSIVMNFLTAFLLNTKSKKDIEESENNSYLNQNRWKRISHSSYHWQCRRTTGSSHDPPHLPGLIAAAAPTEWSLNYSKNEWMTQESFYEYAISVFYKWLPW